MKITISIETSSVEEAATILKKIDTTGSFPASVPSLPVVNNDDEEDDAPIAHTPGQLDKDGLPWDERIHSSSKKQTAKGVWARRKNVPDEVVTQVTAELRSGSAPVAQFTPPAIPQVYSAPAPAPAPVPPLMVPNFAPPAPQNGLNDIPAFIANAQPQYVPPAPAPAPVQVAGFTIQDLFNKVQQLLQTGAADAGYIMSLNQKLSQTFQVQVNSINDIANRPDMIGFAFQQIAADGK